MTNQTTVLAETRTHTRRLWWLKFLYRNNQKQCARLATKWWTSGDPDKRRVVTELFAEGAKSLQYKGIKLALRWCSTCRRFVVDLPLRPPTKCH